MGTGTVGGTGGFIKQKNAMYIYFSYDIEGEDIQEPTEVYLWNRFSENEYPIQKNDEYKHIVASFKIFE